MSLKWIKKLFEPPIDKTEFKIREVFRFLLDDYDFSFVKTDLGNLVDENDKIIFCGPLDVYQLYNDNLCINIVILVQRNDRDVYITEKQSANQHYIFDGMHLQSNLAYDLPLLASQIKSELLSSKTVFGKSI